jgi:hypothetical protein
MILFITNLHGVEFRCHANHLKLTYYKTGDLNHMYVEIKPPKNVLL